MKLIKKFTSVILTLALFSSLFLTNFQVSEAATSVSATALKKAVPSKVRIYPGNEYTSGSSTSTTSIFVPFASRTNCISNIKVSKKGLTTKVTCEERRGKGYNSETYENYGIIGLYSEKEGTYKVSFDVLNKKGGKKLYSKTVTVYVKYDYPVASFKYAGKTDVWSIQSKTKGKLSVKMTKGYKLKSIELGKYVYKKAENRDNSEGSNIDIYKKQETEMVYTKVKNNSTIKLSTVPDYSSVYSKYYTQYSDGDIYSSFYRYLRDRIVANTSVKITYIDKYTKQECTIYYDLQCFAK